MPAQAGIQIDVQVLWQYIPITLQNAKFAFWARLKNSWVIVIPAQAGIHFK